MPSSGRWMALFAGEFRRLRAASYFAHGGSSSQSPLDSVSAWRRKLRSFPCSSSSRRTHFAGLRREQRGIGKNAAGDAADGLRLRYAPPRSIGPLSPDPITGVTPWVRQRFFGAQNLSGGLCFLSGHWALGLQKLGRVRFRRRAWVCRTNGTGPEYGIPHPSGLRPATFP